MQPTNGPVPGGAVPGVGALGPDGVPGDDAQQWRSMGQNAMLRLLWRFARPHRRSLVVGLLLLCLAATVDVVSVLVMADVLNAVLEASSKGAMVRSIGAWVAVTAVGAVLTYFGTIACAKASEGIVLALRDAMFARVQKVPLDRLKQWSVGDVVVRLTEDVVVLETALSSSVVQGVIAALTTVGLVIVAGIMSWKLTIIALIAVPILMGVARAFRHAQERVTLAERKAHSGLAGTLNEIVSTHEHVRLHNMEPAEGSAVHGRGRTLFRARMREARVEALFGGVLGTAEALTLIVVTVGGVLLVRWGELTVGSLLALSGYLAYLYPRIQEISETRLALVGAAVSADRILEVVGDLEPDVGAAHPPREADPVAVTAAGVTFTRSESFTLRVDAFAAAPGTVTAITGPSGSGKSTFGALVSGMERPDAGHILLGGRDESTMSGAQVRAAVTMVPQRAVIRSGTIESNIRYGTDDGADLASAARLARADEFVHELPAGYGTPTTLGGPELSGGQRQRVALARAVARDTPVVVFDEPSTGLDKQNTEYLARSLRALAQRKTVVVITHDPILVAAADSVYEAERGVIAPARAGEPPTVAIPASGTVGAPRALPRSPAIREPKLPGVPADGLRHRIRRR
ncbi:ABC transporter ATP-binding protein [Tsukamurella sp. 8F]|uniref:ABC transporter ATP-binding protein n=1 Tax=unclassified Tsukamurella TaxID=2633480 RepID=UPI0023B91E1C|nr:MULTISPECIES: ABC transporter ATP-binding protein [unclassified Tsukamurella]MDF0530371.1 ABC transporter ATP-binding protein [Tsukamurella sp. 8J]MDF0587668.1 ABC transporter ATP-binding protein [Tsukamurella sp. 8F]